MTDENEFKKLYNSSENYGDDYKDKLFEQYKIFLQMIDNLTHRRTIANSFFLSINTGLLAAFGLLINLEIISLNSNSLWVIGGSIAGILFSYSWVRTVTSYKQLSKVKWTLILELEKKLPLRLHETEWEMLGEGKDKKKYKQLTDVEKVIPFIFIGIYSLIILVILSLLIN